MMSSRLARPAFAAAKKAAPRTIPTFRTYAAAASQVDSKPPVAVYGVDGTYANALYTAAAKTNTLEQASKALASLGEVLKTDPKLNTILHAPTLTGSDKAQIVTELEKHTGGQGGNSTVKNFMDTLAEHNRLGLLEGICEKFGILMGAARGETELTITSAAKLDDKTIKRIESAIAKSEYSEGKKVKVVTKVQPDILGGLVVAIGERTIDFSVVSKINKMNKLLQDSV